MSALRELYQQVIIDHGRHPRNLGELPGASHTKEGFNPLCGDKLKLFLLLDKNVIKEAKFQGSGCAISMASASLMLETLHGKTVTEAEDFFTLFHDLVMGKSETSDALGKLAVLGGVAEFPARVKCATLAWHTLKAALAQDAAPVTTE
ncbi:MAG: SUF system NifU family Fe-S cluster assembly protein [Pseudomonadota bacterium]|nr:SUF system NifU family Fe-S cluster assembly protein [Pseudomonadota bacterium]